MNGRNGSFHDSVTKRLGGQRRWDIRRYFEVRVDGCVLAILAGVEARWALSIRNRLAIRQTPT